jgi:simple sugar transport system ATP-binding protein
MTEPIPLHRPFLRLENIGKRFGGTVALDGVDWSVNPGEVHCLVGENGSGKSTLIKIVAGVHRPCAGGHIVIDGTAFDHLTPYQSKKLGIQVIYQDLSLFPNLSVWENIAIDQELGAPFSTVRRKAMRTTATEVLARLDANLPLNALVGQLSVAERQIVAICRGLAANAKLLFMDEPTSSLTHHEVVRLLEFVHRLKKLGVAVVFVSHRLEEVVALAERVTVLRDGRKVATLPAAQVDDHRLAELMTGSRIMHTVKARKLTRRYPVLEVRGGGRSGEFTDISFALHAGEVLGIIGLMGSGRTELALALFGMTQLDHGEIRVDGKRLKLRSNQDAIRSGIAYVSEDRLLLGLNLRQSIADNTAITLLDRLANSMGLIAPYRRSRLAAEWITRLGIKASNTDAAVQTLSGGNQQRVVLAKWLATNPKILILDTPTAGVDIRNKQGIYDIIHKLADEGVAIVLISDEIPEAYFNSDRILHMREGRMLNEYVPEVTSETLLAEAVFA